MIAELRSELELVEVAIRALEQFAKDIGIEEDATVARSRRRSKPSVESPPNQGTLK
jgi:hypothetical protein